MLEIDCARGIILVAQNFWQLLKEMNLWCQIENSFSGHFLDVNVFAWILFLVSTIFHSIPKIYNRDYLLSLLAF